MRCLWLCFLLIPAGLLPAAAQEKEPSLQDVMKELQELKRRDEEKQKKIDELQRQLGELQKAKDAGAPAAPPPAAAPPGEGAKPGMSEADKKKLEEEFAKALAGDEKKAPEPAPAAAAPARAGAGTLRLIDVSFDLLTDGGASTATEEDVRGLQGGGHDPRNRGFSLVNAELTFAGVVDPYFRGDANIVFQIDEAGETNVELEEAYLTTLELPANLQVKAGQFFTAFGRLNPMHPHAWDFIDQPVVNSRFLGGDGVRGPGVQVAWLTPLPFFCEVTGSVQNAQGETAFSFRNQPDEFFAGRRLVDRDVRSLQDLLYLARIKTSFDLSDETTVVPGASALFGPNASRFDRQTQIYGVDFYLKWKPLTNDKGWPFFAWQTEAMIRRYEAGEAVFNDVDDDGMANASIADGTVAAGRETLEDWGMYSQVVWGFTRPWTAGFRVDYDAGEGTTYNLVPTLRYDSQEDPQRDHRQRYTVDLTYYPSEFSKIRLQYAYDRADFLEGEDAHSVYIQGEISFGAHGAHKF